MKKKTILFTIVSAFIVLNLTLLSTNFDSSDLTLGQLISMNKAGAEDIGEVPIICDQPPPVQGRCTKHDYPWHPEDCIWTGCTLDYCMPW